MKICPQCHSKYTDVSLKFCLQDGSVLGDPSDEKTIELNADSFASDPTVTDQIPGFPTEKTNRSTDGGSRGFAEETDSVATVINQERSGMPRAARVESGQKRGGIGFVAGFLLGALVLGGIGIGFYSAWQFWRGGTGQEVSGRNANAGTEVRTRTISGSSDVNVTAATTRKPDKGNIYTPIMAFDGNPRTAWSEGVRGPGLGQWIVFDFEKEVTLKKILIQPGYFKTPDIWRRNNRVSSVVVEFSDKSKRIYDFPDLMKEQTMDTGGTKTRSVFIAIREIYPGASDTEDTLISEVSFVVE